MENMKNATIVFLAAVVGALGMFAYFQETSLSEQRRTVHDLTTRFETVSKTSSLDLQERCATQARREFTRLGWDKVRGADFLNHYSAEFGKCFMMIVNNSGDFDHKTVFDAFEGTAYATYGWQADKVKKYWEVPPYTCNVTLPSGEERVCRSSDEFDELVNYMRARPDQQPPVAGVFTDFKQAVSPTPKHWIPACRCSRSMAYVKSTCSRTVEL